MSGISNRIPDTDYSLRGGQFIGKDGTALTRDQFVDKVSKKEITLTGDSLKFLDKELGPDMTKSLRLSSGNLTPPGELHAKLDSTTKLTFDLYALEEELTRLVQDGKKMNKEVAHRESKMNIELQEKSAQKEFEAGQWKMWAGIVQGVFTMASGAASVIGGMGATEVSMAKGGGAGKIFDGVGGLVGALFQIPVNNLEKEGRDLGTRSKEWEEMREETRDQRQALNQMESDVRQMLQSREQARAQTAQHQSNM